MEDNKRSSEFKPLGDLVDRLMKAYQLDGKLNELEVLSRWEEMMGKAVSTRTRNLYINGKVLIVELDSAVMREELSYGKNIIIERVNEVAGKQLITDVYFR